MRDEESRPRKLLPYSRPGPNEAVDLEIRHHLEERVDRLVAGGMPPDEARQEAERLFGEVGRVEKELRTVAKETKVRAAVARALEALFQALRLAFRALRRSPGFASVAILTLALGIGANTAIFSVVNGVLLQPLPFSDPNRLIVFWSSAPGVGVPGQFGVSPEMMLQYQEAGAVEDLGLYAVVDGTLTVNDGVERLPMARVTGSFFTTLGVQPVLGRLATDEELAAPLDDRPAIISHALWQTQFGADPGVVSRTAGIDGSTRDIIGVMGPEFTFPGDDVAVWIPHSLMRASHAHGP